MFVVQVKLVHMMPPSMAEVPYIFVDVRVAMVAELEVMPPVNTRLDPVPEVNDRDPMEAVPSARVVPVPVAKESDPIEAVPSDKVVPVPVAKERVPSAKVVPVPEVKERV